MIPAREIGDMSSSLVASLWASSPISESSISESLSSISVVVGGGCVWPPLPLNQLVSSVGVVIWEGW